ncbi:uncharacterized protein [Apostichopus japonicus]|uniref:uncharacterized protein n=1 Tax=Stichopus japonicus TaxID=307972 RepID=UPI003AB14879
MDAATVEHVRQELMNGQDLLSILGSVRHVQSLADRDVMVKDAMHFYLFGRKQSIIPLNDFSSYGICEIPVGSTCTSKPQQWHIPRSTNITPLPVMATHFANAVTDKKDDSRKKDPVRCKLYDARGFNVSDGLSASAVDAPPTPTVGCTPDGKVFNPALKPSFGLLEIKCPMMQRGKKVEEIVKSHDFYIELKDNSEEYILKREHKFGYFTQVQGQMALTGLKWCDFIVYLSDSNEMIATRVPFDEEYWTVIALPKLNSFFIQSIPFLMS